MCVVGNDVFLIDDCFKEDLFCGMFLVSWNDVGKVGYFLYGFFKLSE